MNKGWHDSIIAPIENLLAPKRLLWKEKWGLIRVEGIYTPDVPGGESCPPELAALLEEASHRCCSECGRWHGWAYRDDIATEVTTGGKGWVLTLCQKCRAKMEDTRHG